MSRPEREGDLILAIDAGTQSIRAGLVDLTGTIHCFVKTPIEPYFSKQPGWAEQDPEYYWQQLCETTQQLLADEPDRRERIVAVTLTTQRATMLNLDRDGQPLRPAIVWLDQRKADMSAVVPGFAVPLLKASRQVPHRRVRDAVQSIELDPAERARHLGADRQVRVPLRLLHPSAHR